MRKLLSIFDRRANAGTAAIEFAMIAPVFFLLIFATIETGMAFLADITLQNAVLVTGRLVRTGQAQNLNMSQEQFRASLCSQVQYMLSCDSGKLLIDVRAFANFSGAAYPQALDGQGNLNPDLNSYDTGASSQALGQNSTVLVRAFYKWPLYTPMFARYFANLNGENVRLISSSMAFKNEPF
jgi:Flp pilus assembly protein TadG